MERLDPQVRQMARKLLVKDQAQMASDEERKNCYDFLKMCGVISPELLFTFTDEQWQEILSN